MNKKFKNPIYLFGTRSEAKNQSIRFCSYEGEKFGGIFEDFLK